MERYESELHAEPQNQQGQGRVGPGRCGECHHNIPYQHLRTRCRHREHHERQEKKRFAEDGERHIDQSDLTRFRLFIIDDQPIGRQTDQREREIEADKVGGHEYADAADQCQQPPYREAGRTRLLTQPSSAIPPGGNP